MNSLSNEDNDGYYAFLSLFCGIRKNIKRCFILLGHSINVLHLAEGQKIMFNQKSNEFGNEVRQKLEVIDIMYSTSPDEAKGLTTPPRSRRSLLLSVTSNRCIIVPNFLFNLPNLPSNPKRLKSTSSTVRANLRRKISSCLCRDLDRSCSFWPISV